MSKRYQVSVLVVALVVSGASTTKASFEEHPVGARSTGMGWASIAVMKAQEAVFFNAAALGFLTGIRLSSFFARPFGLKELNYHTVVATKSFSFGGIGMGFKRFGGSLYWEETAVLALGFKWASQFSVGLRFQIHRLSIKNYGSDATGSLGIGFLYRLSPTATWGFRAENINYASIGQRRERLPQSFSTGFMTRPLKGVVFHAEFHKDVLFPLEFRMGAEWELVSGVFLRTGFVHYPATFAFGLGLRFKGLQVDYAAYTHSELGLSHQAALTVVISR